MHVHRLVRHALLAAALVALPAAAQAQGKGHGKGNAGGRVPPGQAKKRYSPGQAADFSREVLVANGYQVQRVEVVGDTRVIYYYRGNNGKGKGHGPLMRMVVRPSAERYVVEGASRTIISEIMRRMGF